MDRFEKLRNKIPTLHVNDVENVFSVEKKNAISMMLMLRFRWSLLTVLINNICTLYRRALQHNQIGRHTI